MKCKKSCKYYDKKEDTCKFTREKKLSKSKVTECGAYENMNGK